MSNVICFLETVGQDSSLRHAGNHEIESVLNDALVDAESHSALLSDDGSLLEALLGARTHMVCAIAPGKEDDDQESEDRPARDDDEEIQLERNQNRLAAA